MDNKVTTRNCPEAFCNGKLIILKNRSTQQEFLGCSNYPKCRYTESIEIEDDFNGVADAASVWE